jgi:hypothetical protein
MKHIKTFENYRIKKNREEIIKEAVLQVNDIYKVRTMIDIPQSLINSYAKKVKDSAGKNLRQFFGDVDIAEEIVKYITLNGLDVDKIPANALMGGGQTQTQGQGIEGEQSIQAQAPVAQAPAQGQPQVQTQVEPTQGQAQTQPQAQAPAQGQAQAPAQQTQGQPGEFEEPAAQGQGGQEEEEEEEEEGEEELPL